MNEAPEKIWAFHAGPMVGLFIGQKEVGTNVAEYVRLNIHESAVTDMHEAEEREEIAADYAVKVADERDRLRAALEKAAMDPDQNSYACGIARAALAGEDGL